MYLPQPITIMLFVLQVREVPGITIFRSSATMYFANAELYLEALKKKVKLFVWNISFSVLWNMTVVLNQGSTKRPQQTSKGAFHTRWLKIIYKTKHKQKQALKYFIMYKL